MDPSTFTEGRAPAIAADPHRRQSQQAYRHVFRAQPASLNDQSPLAPASTGGITTDSTTTAWYDHSSGHRTNTDAFLAYHLSLQYPQLELVVTPQYLCDLLAFAAAGKASFKFLNTETIKVGKMGDLRQIANEGQPRSSAVFGEAPSAHMHTIWMPPSKRMDGGQGVLALDLQFGRLLYRYKDEEFLVYIADTTYGGASYGTPMCYILSPDRLKAEELVAACGRWSNDLHEEVWVFDQGYWQKSRDLYRSVAEASWDNVILDPDMKRSLIQDHMSFYNSRETYRRLKVPWKRGIIYYGPPGNGKTISVKAMMNMLSKQPDPIPTLYVRTLAGVSGSPRPHLTSRRATDLSPSVQRS